MTNLPTSGEKTTTCRVCGQGTLRRGKRLFVTTDSFLECDHCHTQFYREQGKYILRNVSSNFNRWKEFEGQLLSDEEIVRISSGGLSDAQIAKRDEEIRLQLAKQLAKQEEERRLELQRQEEHKKQEQTPGTPEWYFAKYKTILGIPADETKAELSFSSNSVAQARQQINRIRQMQKELRLLKKEVTLKIKEVRSSAVTTRRRDAFGDALRQLRDARMAPYQFVVEQVDSTLIQLDRVKLQLENAIAGNAPVSSLETRQETPVQQRESSKNNKALQLEPLLNELNSLVGLESVKAEVTELINFLKVQKLRHAKGMPTAPLSLHVVFFGNPGTGKTSVARLLSKIYQSLGILSSGQLVETDRSGLVAGYVGQTALKVNEVVNKALGGILFIDEAYSLTQGYENDFGKEAINTLIKQMEDNRDNLAVIVAGYTDKMEQFLSSNPGLRSRFNRYWKFEDYTPIELIAIFESFCKTGGFQLSTAAREKLTMIFQQAYDHRDKTFGNARFARNLFEASISNQASRIVDLKNISVETLATIEPEDIPTEVSAI